MPFRLVTSNPEGLVPIAKRWYEQMGLAVRFPEPHQAFLERCIMSL